MTWQDDIATVREGYGWDDPAGDLGRVEFDAALARLGARLEKADRLANALRKIVACDYRGNIPPEQGIARAALADWDGDTT